MTRGPPSPEAKCTSLAFLRPGDWGCSDQSADAAEQESDQGYAQQATYEAEILRQLSSRFIFDPLLTFTTHVEDFKAPRSKSPDAVDNLGAQEALEALQLNFASYPKSLQLIFPGMGLHFDFIPQAQCPVNIPVESELFQDNESNSSGLDLLEELGENELRSRRPEAAGTEAATAGQRPSTWPSTTNEASTCFEGRKQPVSSIDNPFIGSEGSVSASLGPTAEVFAPARDGEQDSGSSSEDTGSPGPEAAPKPKPDETRMAQCQRIASALTSKLNLPATSAELNNYVIALGQREGLAGLDREKRKVKFVLRKYDAIFQKHYGNPPTRAEKEPMRQLYVYYRKVKVTMDRFSSNQSRTSSSNNGARRRREPPQTDQMVTSASDRRVGGVGARRDSATWSTDQSPDNVLRTSSDSRDLSVHTFNNRPLEDLERKLAKMVAQKQVLAKRLQAYQELFEQRHGRRIRYHRDIVDIDGDYRKYKKLRSHVAQLTETVKARRCLLTARGERSSATSGTGGGQQE